MKHSTRGLLVLAIVLMSVPVSATPDQPWGRKIRGRCEGDMAHNMQMVLGRNAWAKKCDYLPENEEAELNARAKYVTFSNFDAPFDGNAPCIQGGYVLADCRLGGCFTAGQRVKFGGNYLPIDTAAMDAGITTVTALKSNWFLEDELSWTEEPIGWFTLGDEHKPVLRITAENGLSVEVTQTHPMVDGDGNITEASEVRTGMLLSTELGASAVTSVVSRPYDGKVWNLEPSSLRTEANIHLAEGFLTGSVRFQDEWAKDESRRRLRHRINADAF